MSRLGKEAKRDSAAAQEKRKRRCGIKALKQHPRQEALAAYGLPDKRHANPPSRHDAATTRQTDNRRRDP
jgi:hypothetical protein